MDLFVKGGLSNKVWFGLYKTIGHTTSKSEKSRPSSAGKKRTTQKEDSRVWETGTLKDRTQKRGGTQAPTRFRVAPSVGVAQPNRLNTKSRITKGGGGVKYVVVWREWGLLTNPVELKKKKKRQEK